jgi:hypothetical protein
MIYNLPDHRTGDTWKGVNTITLLNNGIPINLIDCDVYIHFRSSRNKSSPVVLELTTDNESIVVLEYVRGLITIPEQLIEIPPDKYDYELQINFPDGTSKTFLKGVFNVLPETTRIKNDYTNKNNQRLLVTAEEEDRILTTSGERLNYIISK